MGRSLVKGYDKHTSTSKTGSGGGGGGGKDYECSSIFKE